MASIYDQTEPPDGYMWDGHGHLIPLLPGMTAPPNPYRPPPPIYQPPASDTPAPGSDGPGSWAPPPGYWWNPATGRNEPIPGTTPPGVIDDPNHPGGFTYPTPPAPPPPSGGPTTTGPRTTGPAPGSAPTPFAWPEFHAPGFDPQTAPEAPPPFTHPDFVAPTLDEAKNQPGYKFGFDQGVDAIKTAAGAKGILRGGGTLKALFDYGNAAAEQNYANVYRQNADTYNTNLGKDLGTYTTNWGVTKDVSNLGNAAKQGNYQDAFQNAGAEFNPKFQGAQLSFTDMYNRWLANLNAQLHIFDQGGV